MTTPILVDATATNTIQDPKNRVVEVKESEVAEDETTAASTGETNITDVSMTENIAIVPASRSDPTSYVFSPMVKIRVGNGSKPCYAHKALLTAYSPYFEACLNSMFVEGQSCEIDMVEEDEVGVLDNEAKERAFVAFTRWLYTGNLESEKSLISGNFGFVKALYAVADRLLVCELKNLLVDEYRRGHRETGSAPWPTNVKLMSELGLLDTKLGDFFLSQLTWRFCKTPSSWVEDKEDETSVKRNKYLREVYQDHGAVTELLKYTIKFQIKPWDDPIYAADCDFHEHPDGKLCEVQTRHKPK